MVYGGRIFPDIDKAEVVFVDEKEYLRNPLPGDILIGLGGGDDGLLKRVIAVFDEHRPDGRLKDTCAALLVAEYLKVSRRREVSGLLQEALSADTEAVTTMSQLANLIKAMHRVKAGADQLGTFDWAYEACLAIIDGRYDDSLDIRDAWLKYCREEGVDKAAAGSIGHKLSKSFENAASLTELSHIYACMGDDVREKWIKATFGLLVTDYQNLGLAVQELEAKGQKVAIKVKGKEELAILVEGDGEYYNRAASMIKPNGTMLLVVRSGRGLTQVHLNPHKHEGMTLELFAQAVRMTEYRKRTDKLLPRQKAMGNGTVVDCPNWHFPNGSTMLNGSLTHPSVQPSVITVAELAEMVEALFSDDPEDWFDRYYTAV